MCWAFAYLGYFSDLCLEGASGCRLGAPFMGCAWSLFFLPTPANPCTSTRHTLLRIVYTVQYSRFVPWWSLVALIARFVDPALNKSRRRSRVTEATMITQGWSKVLPNNLEALMRILLSPVCTLAGWEGVEIQINKVNNLQWAEIPSRRFVLLLRLTRQMRARGYTSISWEKINLPEKVTTFKTKEEDQSPTNHNPCAGVLFQN